MNKIKVAIIGASGYSGEELLRLLPRHPEVAVACITSRQYAGQHVSKLFSRFAESKLYFVEPDVAQIAATADAAFLALPHGLAAEYALPLLEAGLKVIDISADFRLKDADVYRSYYKVEHPAPEWLDAAVYGLPERYRQQLTTARLTACAGCYPTSIILPLFPLLQRGLVSPQNIIASSMSGVSGAGRKVDLPYLFPECNESVRAYGVSGHRHLPEIEQELGYAVRQKIRLNFIPHLVPVNRGIHSTIVVEPMGEITPEKIAEAYADAYANEQFVRRLPPGALADTKHVTMTNMIEIGFVIDKHTGKLIISSAIDNLTKGAAGQAIQCFNIMFGLEETLGLL